MGCLFGGLAAVLLLVIPAAIARTTLVGAYVVLALITALALTGVRWRTQRRGRRPVPSDKVPRLSLARVGIGACAYAALVAVIHFT